MVKLTEVEDEHFTTEKPTPSKNDALLASDDDDDEYTDTDSEISTDSGIDIENETLYERIAALKDIIPPQTRRRITTTVSSLTSFTKSSLLFSGKALWVLSTSAFLLGVPWALAYAEEEQYIQMEREQGMIKGANEKMEQDADLKFISDAHSWGKPAREEAWSASSVKTYSRQERKDAMTEYLQVVSLDTFPLSSNAVHACPRLLQIQDSRLIWD
ncbi:Mitochondrial import receptor subunit tom22 [Rasamsonia emersonii CBS 393.64]|uniref:Mitochondrial import receptor subunit tom22 n=1 Tax=Rasamsonia emersonii (strain ATCC 16479 / CBS 393.64 / IMI 116815) TaxID=1408163 RepID=A0A0F4Z2Z3_RASE3|nr:Mitochondrial import receptor subunit tom22 [Rasamsonia emersonii CBS 393.64]KKA24894.1 Mitochondrial import receptor subunit tom22 [Rasamsonia emersonii CBS 393.64]